MRGYKSDNRGYKSDIFFYIYFFYNIMEIPSWIFIVLVIFLISFELRSWLDCCMHINTEEPMPESVKHMYS